jgi:hypothetical protein
LLLPRLFRFVHHGNFGGFPFCFGSSLLPVLIGEVFCMHVDRHRQRAVARGAMSNPRHARLPLYPPFTHRLFMSTRRIEM